MVIFQHNNLLGIRDILNLVYTQVYPFGVQTIFDPLVLYENGTTAVNNSDKQRKITIKYYINCYYIIFVLFAVHMAHPWEYAVRGISVDRLYYYVAFLLLMQVKTRFLGIQCRRDSFFFLLFFFNAVFTNGLYGLSQT